MTIKANWNRIAAHAYLWLLLLLLYLPIIIIIVYSFTEAKVLGNWSGFSLRLYSNLFSGTSQGAHTLYAAIENTIIIALLAATVSTLMGTVAAIGIHNMRGMARRTVTFLSTYIYADARKGGLTPELSPLSALIFVTMLLLLVVVNIRASRQKKEQKKKGK